MDRVEIYTGTIQNYISSSPKFHKVSYILLYPVEHMAGASSANSQHRHYCQAGSKATNRAAMLFLYVCSAVTLDRGHAYGGKQGGAADWSWSEMGGGAIRY